ncbi:hypothetical protein Nepgr_024781 [Nepenthes gracilis]|uniref:Uncharacterized protein n=1 Tax=Nepenthes gracilis TaxID=150966 RepID=A0AAD3T3I1_NEPGR|nr:hypothetical protein Nepgr_024781 [Nepenthes gracilis]
MFCLAGELPACCPALEILVQFFAAFVLPLLSSWYAMHSADHAAVQNFLLMVLAAIILMSKNYILSCAEAPEGRRVEAVFLSWVSSFIIVSSLLMSYGVLNWTVVEDNPCVA